METHRSLGLQIPERTTSPEGSFLAVPKEVEAWAASLPVANVGETARKVFQSVVEFNRMELPILTRIRGAETLREPSEYVSGNLKKYYHDSAFPLSPKNRKVAVLNRELYIEQATAYKIFIEETVAGPPGKIDRKSLVIALHRAISSLLSVLYQSAVVYDVYPQGLWQEVHSLFAFAERHQYLQLPVREARGSNTSSTISDIYRRALLFSTCSPYRLRQRETAEIYRRLPAWARLVEVEMPGNRREEGAWFVVRLDSDHPPVPLDILRGPVDRNCRQLDCHGLLLYLRKQIEEQSAAQPKSISPISTGDLSKQQLRNLVRVLSSSHSRRFVRTRLNFELKTAVGLTAIHALLNADPEPGQLSEPVGDDHEIDWFQPDKQTGGELLYPPSQTPEFTISPMDMPSESRILQNTNIAGSDEPVWASSAEQPLPDPFPCKTSNESAGGYCILWHGAKAPRIKVGELIGIQSASQRNQFGIGVSRWIKNKPGQGLEVGLELISPTSQAKLAEPVQSTDGASSLRCLLLPEVTAAGQSATLVTLGHSLKVGDEVWVVDDASRRKARLTRLQESTGAFAQFEFVYINEPFKEREGDAQGDEENFDNIWSAL